MSLDQNLFTLNFNPNKDDPTVTDLVDGAGVVHYHKQRVSDAVEYRMNVYDPISEALLASATAPAATSKTKTIELHNPNSVIELKFVGTITFRWSFMWEEHEFEWKREECYMIRKPDPPVLVAVTKEASGRIKTSTVQLLDYNLNRFDIYDRKGLELVILTALLTFQDQSEDQRKPSAASSPAGRRTASRADSGPSTPPVPPPKPAPKKGVERVAELHALRRETVNEVTVEGEGPVDDWAQLCLKLLQDEDMLFITLHSASADEVPKVLQVVEETKRRRHKSGVAQSQELFQYVVYDSAAAATTGSRVINLDGPSRASSSGTYAPPTRLTVHLSKIAMPELQPNVSAAGASQPSSSNAKPRSNGSSDAPKSPTSGARLQKQPHPSANLRTSAQKTHAAQPSPSQLNNPMLNSAPQPQRPSSARPHTPSSTSWFGQRSPPATDGGASQRVPPPPDVPPARPTPGPRPSTHYAPHIPGLPAPPPGPGYANPYAANSPTAPPTAPGKPASEGVSGSVSGLLGKISSHLRL